MQRLLWTGWCTSVTLLLREHNNTSLSDSKTIASKDKYIENKQKPRHTHKHRQIETVKLK